jgi:hypothetical protein
MCTKAWIVATAGARMLAVSLAAAAFSFSALPADASCSCSGMTVKTSGTTGTMCSNRNLTLPECTKSSGSSKGCSTTYAYDCPLGVNDKDYGAIEPSQKTGFQPVATLTGGSTTSQCTTGQVLQETIMSGSSVEPNPKINPTSLSGVQTLGTQTVYIDNNASNQFPQVGATSGGNQKFGGDDYLQTDTDVLMSVTSTAISWWDNTDQTKDSQAEAATWRYRFISYVIGSGSSATSCQCSFEIKVDWPSNSSTPATAYSAPSCSTW